MADFYPGACRPRRFVQLTLSLEIINEGWIAFLAADRMARRWTEVGEYLEFRHSEVWYGGIVATFEVLR